MVGIRSPIGLVVGSCTSHPGVLGSIPKREEPGKTGAPCVKVPGSSRVPLLPPRAQLCIKYCSNKQQQPCVVVRPVHTSLCSLYLIAHVSHCHPPPTHSFELGTTVINNNNLNYSQKRVSTTLIMNSATTIVLHSRGQSRYHHSVLCSSSMTWQRKTSRSLNQDT